MKAKKKKDYCVRALLSWSLIFALAVTWLPADILSPAGSAKTVSAQTVDEDVFVPDADRIKADSLPAKIPTKAEQEQIQSVTMKEGNVSSNGLQNVTFVDETGKKVDLEEESEKISGVTSEEVAEEVADTAMTEAATASNQSSMGGIRNQGSWGLCWAFSSIAALEANILTKKSCSSVATTAADLDLSERHMGWFAHNTYSTLATDPTKKTDGVKKTTAKAAYTGGNYYQALAYLTRGSGAGLEEDTPYSNTMGGVPEAERYDAAVTVHDSYEVSYDIKNDANNSIAGVKALIDKYGAAGCSYYDRLAGYSTKTGPNTAFYQTLAGTNHAVCAVGYDDTYAVTNFTGTAGQPPKPGAWLIRNSWGSSFGNNGYFWISYYDASLAGFFAYNATDSANYGDIYQHDPTGMHSNLGVNATANVFQARRDDTLKSVGIYVSSAVQKGTIQIYTGDKKFTNPTDGNLSYTQSISAITHKGYHIIDLGKTVSVSKGQYFSIVVTLGDSGSTSMYSFEGKSGCKAWAGQSYYLWYGQWYDAYKQCGNACIKALMTSESDNLDALNEQLALAANVTKASLADFGGDATYNWIQKEVRLANEARKAKRDDDIIRATRRLSQAMSQTASYHLYADSARTLGTGCGGTTMYVNGGKFKKNGVTNLYGARTFYFSVNKVYSFKVSKGRYIPAYNGYYVAAVTSTNKKPTLGSDGKVTNPDTVAESKVKVKISGSKVTITPLASGTVYVWVLYFPKLGKAYSYEEDDYAVTKVTVGETAPTAVKLYDSAAKAKNCTDTTIAQYVGTVIPQGGSTSVYVAGTTGKRTKKIDTLAASKLDGTNYEPIVPVKYQNYITIDRDVKETNKYVIRVAPDILDVFKVKPNKTLAVTVPFYCNKNSRKINFKLTIGNPVKTISLAATDGQTALQLQNGANGIAEVTLQAPTTKAAVAGYIVETKQLYDTVRSCTDGTAVLRMAQESDLIFTAANVATISTKLTPDQKKVTMALQKDKMTYKITAAKGTPAGTTVYFVIRHNAYTHQSGAGYKIVKVTVQ